MSWVEVLTGGVIGFGSSVFAESVRARLLRPELAFETGRFLGCILEPRELAYTLPGLPDTPLNTTEAIYCRLRIVNKRRWPAKHVRLFLTRIDAFGHDGKWTSTGFADTLMLPWSCRAPGQFEAIDLPCGIPHFADLMSSREGKPHDIQMEVLGWRERYPLMLDHPGVYRFTITATSDNAPSVSTTQVLCWNLTWKALRTVSSEDMAEGGTATELRPFKMPSGRT